MKITECGCEVKNNNIEYCHLHNAAPKLFAFVVSSYRKIRKLNRKRTAWRLIEKAKGESKIYNSQSLLEELAWAVLDGDDAALLPLIDKLIEEDKLNLGEKR